MCASTLWFHSSRFECEESRRVAQVYYEARNLFFQQASAAYSAGDGRLAAVCSQKGRQMGELAKKHRDIANEAVSDAWGEGDGRLAAVCSQKGRQMGE